MHLLGNRHSDVPLHITAKNVPQGFLWIALVSNFTGTVCMSRNLQYTGDESGACLFQ